MNRDERAAVLALRAGADGYIVKDGPSRHLDAAIQYIQDGGIYFSPIFPPDLLSRERTRFDLENRLAALSERERDVFHYLVQGSRPKDIAEFGVSPATVDTHQSKMMEKLGIHDLPGPVKYAIKWRLISE